MGTNQLERKPVERRFDGRMGRKHITDPGCPQRHRERLSRPVHKAAGTCEHRKSGMSLVQVAEFHIET